MNLKRRNLFKLLFFGSGALWLGNLAGKFGLNSKEASREFLNFKIVEDGDKLIFYNKNGKRIFTLSEDGTLEVS